MTTKIADVAAHAGVSIATVSRALRNLPGVSEPTRDRVLGSAHQLGYVMTPTAIGPSTGGDRRISVVLPKLGPWFFGLTLGSLAQRLTACGYSIEVTVLGDPGERSAFFTSTVQRRRMAGLIMIGLSLSTYELGSLDRLGAAVIGLHSSIGDSPTVGVDDAAMARCAVDHLIGLGHRDIGMITSDPGHPLPHLVPSRRTAGYRDALQVAGIPLDENREVCGGDSVAGGARAMCRLLTRHPFPSAVFVHTDEMAFGALSALRGAGLRVPGDVAVVSIDDHELSSAFQLTTVRQHVGNQAFLAAELLVRELAGSPITRPLGRACPPLPEPHLIVRGTTAPPRLPRSAAMATARAGTSGPRKG
jgi:LacI family repressor for deo operon, udp, cdd, tsx, nupC, and nupG